MENSLPLNQCHVKKADMLINRLHIFLHGIALQALFYYRFTTLNQIIQNRSTTPLLPYILIIISELILAFIWVIGQASKWKPVVRTVHPEHLPRDDELPSIDVFVCTADPRKEPTVDVMNTVLSAMALDYPPDKLHVYVSDDAGSSVTFRAVEEVWKFAKWWIPFCRKYGVTNGCPEAYFTKEEGDSDKFNGAEFAVDEEKIQEKYRVFRDSVMKIAAEASTSRDHPARIEVISDANGNAVGSNQEEIIPLLVYVAREKRPSQHHHFKAGALNVLIRVSSLISNSPYILMLDCDMYCNDRGSARQAMCFHLDSKLSQKLAFVQFPQKFYNISQTDIYDCQLRFTWPKFQGFDGLRGPILSGTNFYMKREALYGSQRIQEADVDLVQLQRSFGSSKEFIKSMYRYYRPDYKNEGKLCGSAVQEELQLLASCSYDNDTKWGKEVGFRYFSVVEDYFTGFNLHCEGWSSVYLNPSKPCFLGASPISLGEILVQHTRWYAGLMQIVLSRFSPLLYGPLRMSALQSMCYAEFAYYALYFVPVYVLAVIPQLCLLRDIPLYPEVSSPFFLVFSFVFISSQLKHVQEIFSSGHSITSWSNEQRIWMMKSATSYMYASLDAMMEKIGLRRAIFLPTNKVVDEDQAKRYQAGVYDFQASPLFMVPLCSLYILNLASCIIGLGSILLAHRGNEMFIQAFIPLFGTILHFPLLEGMVLRKDRGRISQSVSLLSAVISAFILSIAYLKN